MKYFKTLIVVLLLSISLIACTEIEDIEEPLTYQILINEDVSREFKVGDTIDFKQFFIIMDSNDELVQITDSMIDASNVNMQQVGSYIVKISYSNYKNQITIHIGPNDSGGGEDEITYTITINDDISTSLLLNSQNIDFKSYFIKIGRAHV